MSQGHAWAEEEFGAAKLGDARRVARLVQVARGAAHRPAGQVTAVFEDVAAREGAFRLLENEAVPVEEVARAAHLACAGRAKGEEFVYVPVDGTSLNITDRQREKGLGLIGARFVGATGLQVMSAIAVSPAGVPLGLCGQSYWTRPNRSPGSAKNNDSRPVEEKETYQWLKVMEQVRSALAEKAPATAPWFQLDRGGDAWPVILDGLRDGELFTVRASYNRRLTKRGPSEQEYLRSWIEKQPVLGESILDLPAMPARHNKGQPKRPARRARKGVLEIRASEVSLDVLTERRPGRTGPKLYAVLARETRKSAGTEEPIEWLLLTSFPVRTADEAKLVLQGYGERWRVEEFHKSWKTGACKVEDTQLRDLDHIIRWATVLASVAMRILRLTYSARATPEASPLGLLSRSEVDAIVIAAKSKKHKPGSTPTIGIMVDLLARLGGYTGKSSGGPPGALVLARGLLGIEFFADALETGLVTITQKRKK